jgi:hypothetical protein
MRNHGVTNFPDPTPDGNGGYEFQFQGGSKSQLTGSLQAAQDACKALSPQQATGQQLSTAEQQGWLAWARCIRGHGVPNFPDPDFSAGGVSIANPGGTNSAQMNAATAACRSQEPIKGRAGG